MPSRIVTSTYRYKRPPRKRKAVPLEGPAVVTSRSKAAPAVVERVAKPGNDNRPEPPTPLPTDGKKSAVVTTTRRGRRPKPDPEIDPDAVARVQAFLARVVRPP